MELNSYFLKSTLTIFIFIILFVSIFRLKKKKAQLTLKILSIVASSKAIVFLLKNNKVLLNLTKLTTDFRLKFQLPIILDTNFILFSTTALIVTWSIMEFSLYYMSKDTRLDSFTRLLMLFLLRMLILTSSKNLFVIFIGWELVGFLSFLLIGWWSTRRNANTAALQAIVYNRIGDIGMILLLIIIIFLTKGWKLTRLEFLNQTNQKWIKLLLFSTLIAAIGKSAQFSLHPWLPAAMEGPTPVSALLHSSTMVVAGIFLLIRITKISRTTKFLYTCSIIGALTAIFAATSAFRQHDLKKIIAYSTTRQLGLMLLAIGLGNPKIALFHICTHAFFKAMLFLCSGRIIHKHKKEQDLRKMSNIKISLPVTSACLLLGRVSLMGIPFLSGFFSKDVILESIIKNPKNILVFLLATRATFLTAAYSFRIITLCFYKKTRQIRISPMREENKKLSQPLLRLAAGSIITGWVLSKWLFKVPSIFPKIIVKKVPLLVTLLGSIIASTIILSIKTRTKVSFFTKTWFYQQIAHIVMKTITLITALIMSTQTLDRGWKETAGGQGIFILNNKVTQKIQIIQSGYLKQYLLSIFTVLASILFILLII